MALTLSIMINLLIRPGLNNFLLCPLLSIVFVQECSVVLRKVFFTRGDWKGTHFCPLKKIGEPGYQYVKHLED